MPSYKIPQKKKKYQELEFDDRMKSIIAEYQSVGYTYSLNLVEKEALIFEKYKQRFKASYNYTVSQIYRIKHHNEEYIVYRNEEQVTDSNNQVHKWEGQRGWHTSPIVEQTGAKNEFGEPTGNLKLVGQATCDEIPFNREFLKDLINNSSSAPADLCVGRGNNSPPDIISSNPQKIWNKKEFIKCDWEDLFGASVAGYSKLEYCGVKAYQQSRQTQAKQQQNVAKS